MLKRTKGRARRGERAVRVVQGRRGHNLTMTFAVSARAGLSDHDLFQGGMAAERFNGFLNHVSEIYQPEMDVSFVFDNARAQMQARNLELPEGFNIKYLPPYSPFPEHFRERIQHLETSFENKTSKRARTNT